MISKKHKFKKWIVSLIEVKDSKGSLYKITRRIPELSVSEIILFRSKKEAEKQFEDWLN